MIWRRQRQASGNASVNWQAGRDIVVAGLSYDDVKSVALDVYRAEYEKLSGAALATARDRVEYLTDRFLRRLLSELPDKLGESGDPDFQYSLHVAQVAYVRSGERDKADVLIELLVRKTVAARQSLEKLSLSRAVDVMGSLTASQISLLTLVFACRQMHIAVRVYTLEEANRWFGTFILPFFNESDLSGPSFAYLESTGCISMSPIRGGSRDIFLHNFPGLFAKAVAPDAAAAAGADLRWDVFIAVPDGSGKRRFAAHDVPTLRRQLQERHVAPAVVDRVVTLYRESRASFSDVDHAIEAHLGPEYARFAAAWDGSTISEASLTSVGTAIGHLNLCRLTSFSVPLSYWFSGEAPPDHLRWCGNL